MNLNYDRDAFVSLVLEMREVQTEFFNGNRSVVARAKKLEANVDKFIQKAFSDARTTQSDWVKRPGSVEQKGLF